MFVRYNGASPVTVFLFLSGELWYLLENAWPRFEDFCACSRTKNLRIIMIAAIKFCWT